MNFVKLAAAALVAVLISTGSNAQAPEQPPPGGSMHRRRQDARARRPALFQRDTRQLVPDPRASAGRREDRVMMVQLPLGLSLTEPVLLKVDNGQPERQSIGPAPTRMFRRHAVPEKFSRPCARKELKLTTQDNAKKSIVSPCAADSDRPTTR